MEVLFILVLVCIGLCVLIGAFYLLVNLAVRAQNPQMGVMGKQYKQALEELVRKPDCPQAREACFESGRIFYKFMFSLGDQTEQVSDSEIDARITSDIESRVVDIKRIYWGK
jgi:hypothetical protein